MAGRRGWLVAAAVLLAASTTVACGDDSGVEAQGRSDIPTTTTATASTTIGPSGEDPGVVESYDLNASVAADGRMTATETLDVALPAGRHGIYRTFYTDDPRRTDVDHLVDVDRVRRDGEPEPWSWVKTDQPDQRRLRIGDPDVEVDGGTYRYEIDWTTPNSLEPGPEDDVWWWWDVVGDGWQMPIESARATVAFPVEPVDAECIRGDEVPCQATIEGRTVSVASDDLGRENPLTVRVTFPPGALPTPPG